MARSVSENVIRRTEAFYLWERRGRGWQSFSFPVELEPPFVLFPGHLVTSPTVVDDGLRPHWLERLFLSLSSQSRTETLGKEPQEAPALPEAFTWDEEPVEFQILLGKDNSFSPEASSRWLSSLRLLERPCAFELLGSEGGVTLQLAVSNSDRGLAESAFASYLGSAQTITPEESLEERWVRAEGPFFSAMELGLAREFMLSLATPPRKPDSLRPFVGAVARIPKGQIGLVQVLFRKAEHPWPASILRAVTTSRGEPFFLDDRDFTKKAVEKVASPLYAATLRLAATGESLGEAFASVRNMASGLAQFESPQGNELIPLASDFAVLEEDLLGRTTHRSGMLLSEDELSFFAHFPVEDFKIPAFAQRIPQTKRAPEEVRGTGVLLGENHHLGQRTEVRLSPQSRLQHIHMVGASGTGKSTLMISMILDDIRAGHGVGVIDPHGDLVGQVLSRIPEERGEDVVLLDPADPDFVVGWNFLQAGSEVEKDLLASDLVGTFRRLSTSWGDQMDSLLSNAILAFLESEKPGTLVDLREFLVDENFRRDFLRSVPDEYLTSFWQTEFPLIASRKPQAPILTRLNTFLRSRLIREVVTAEKQTLDFRGLIDQKRIFLCNLAQGRIGEENAALLGSLLVSKLHQVTLSRQDIEEERREPFFLFVDEFHDVATPSMASLFSGVRKFRLGVTVAHQQMFQLHAQVPEVERALLGNAYTRISFRVGDEDAKKLAEGFESFDADDLANLSLGQAICRVGGKRNDFDLKTFPLPALDAVEARDRREELRRRSGEQYGKLREIPGERAVVEAPPVVVEVPLPETKRRGTPRQERAPAKVKRSPGRGGSEHKYLQEFIKKWGQARGYLGTLEKDIPGGRVDVVLERAEQSIAVEIAVSSTLEREIRHLQKAVEAGFDEVVTVSRDEGFLQKLRERLPTLLDEGKLKRVHLFSPEELCAFLREEPPRPSDDNVAGYTVRMKVRKPSKTEAEAQKRAIADVIHQGLKRTRGKKG